MRKIVSLFSGCGGMDLGFEGGFTARNLCLSEKVRSESIPVNHSWSILPRTDFETVMACDITRHAKAAWEPYFVKRNRAKFVLGSVVDLVKAHKTNGSVFPLADIVTGGFPCQDYSLCGKRKGFNSDVGHNGEDSSSQDENRGMLYLWMKEVIDLVRPKVFIAENVQGLTVMGGAVERIKSDFASVGGGYHVFSKLLMAQDYGVPQNRHRVFFIGVRIDATKLTPSYIESLIYPLPTHSDQPSLFSDGLLSHVPCREVLTDLPEPCDSNDPSHIDFSHAKFLPKGGQGQIEVDLDKPSMTIRSEHHGNIEFRRLRPENGGKYQNEIDWGLEERRLTPRECARLQTFPDDYEFVRSSFRSEYSVTTTDAYKLIGNAVPPLLAYSIARRLEETWGTLFG